MKKYIQLQEKEREAFYKYLQTGMRMKDIAELLGRHKSTLYRERNRNKKADIGYLPDTAHKLAEKRKAHHEKKMIKCPLLREIVIEKLKCFWSPEIISGWLKTIGYGESISTETIYQFIYSDEGSKLDLYQYLDRHKKRRGKMHGRKSKGGIPNRTSVHDRPKEIDTREIVGHFEGDLIIGHGNGSHNIAVLVERKSRYTMLTKNNDKKTTTVMQKMFNQLGKLPANARKSVTFDNGLEFASHQLLGFLSMATFFCDPGSPGQKGSVERVNRSIRRKIKKKMSIKEISAQTILDVQNWLNRLPRKCLGFRTPEEVLNQELAMLQPC
jgi:IS30 family transposase